jgi:hypothetical protein
MPPLEVSDLNQQAILWPFTGYDRYSQPVLGTPVLIPVRWITKRRRVLDAKGNTIDLDAEAVVDRQIDIGSVMWLATGDALADWFGVLSYWAGTGSGLTDDERCEVKIYSEASDVKGRFVRRTVGLVRFHQ